MRRSQDYRPEKHEKAIDPPKNDNERNKAFNKVVSETHKIVTYWKRVGESTVRSQEYQAEIQKKDFRDIAEKYGSKSQDPQIERKVGEQINQLLDKGINQEEIQSLLNTWRNIGGAFNTDTGIPSTITWAIETRKKILQNKEISDPVYLADPTSYQDELDNYLLDQLSNLELNTIAAFNTKKYILGELQEKKSPNDSRIIKIQQDISRGVDTGKSVQSEQDIRESVYQNLRKEAFIWGETLQRYHTETITEAKDKLQALAKAHETNIREFIKSETFRRINPTWTLQKSLDDTIDKLAF